MDMIDIDLYQESQRLYYSLKSLNELIRRSQREFNHPDFIDRVRGNREINWTVVNYWNVRNKEVEITGLPALIKNRIRTFDSALTNLPNGIESEMSRLKEEIGKSNE